MAPFLGTKGCYISRPSSSSLRFFKRRKKNLNKRHLQNYTTKKQETRNSQIYSTDMTTYVTASEPAASGEYFIWNLLDHEREAIDKMLDCDLISIGLKKSLVVEDRCACPGCGKLSGLDDFVENALRYGIHGQEFMLRVMTNKYSTEGSPGHHLECSNCQTSFGMTFFWIPAVPWI